MQTPARKRAEALFAKFTTQVDRPADTGEPVADRPTSRASGPKTLHLPSDTQPSQPGAQVTTRRRNPKAPRAKPGE